MSKYVNYSHISFYKTEFDLLYEANIKSEDPIKLQKTVERMTDLQDKIINGLKCAPVNISRYFTGKLAPSSAYLIVDAEKMNIEVQKKLEFMIIHSSDVAPLTNRVHPITMPSLPPAPINPSSSELPTPSNHYPKATDFAVGFRNLSANCWANSLLSMILSMPNFKRAYEAVANHYAQDNGNLQNQLHGKALLNALRAYDAALTLKQPVPASITQDVRLAFNHFFGRKNPLTFHEIFSIQAYRQEDPWEAMQILMGLYEQITRQGNSNPLPEPYSPLQTKRHYRPIGGPQPANPEKLHRDDYSRLTKDNVSPFINDDYQIILDLQNKGHLTFPALLSEYFRNTHIQGNDTGTYLLPDGQIQQFELIGEGRQFIQVPEELLLTVKRFGATLEGQGYKIVTPLAINQTLVLPADATSSDISVAYELDAFNVHSGGYGGGHYIAYRKIRGQWIEVNDGSVRFVNDQEIDQILFGQKGATFTSYMHHYTRVPQSRQQELIASAASAPTIVPTVPLSELETLSLKKLTCEQSIHQLETLNALLKTPTANLSSALENLGKTAPDALTTLRHAIWLHDKTPEVYNYGTTTLKQNPSRIQDIKLPWLIAPIGANLIEQMLVVQRIKLQITTEKLKEAQLRSFLEKVNASSVSNEELLIALQALPEIVQHSLHGLVYHSHLKKFGKEHVNKEEYHREYGRLALEKGDIRKTLTEATESVLNLWGRNILEQLIEEHRIHAEKLRCAYEKEQLQGLHDLLLRPSSEITNDQLFKAFERLEVRNEIREKLYWHIWYGLRSPQIYNYGYNTFKDNPRCVLGICEPNLARPPICGTGSNILFQLIKLLEREAR